MRGISSKNLLSACLKELDANSCTARITFITYLLLPFPVSLISYLKIFFQVRFDVFVTFFQLIISPIFFYHRFWTHCQQNYVIILLPNSSGGEKFKITYTNMQEYWHNTHTSLYKHVHHEFPMICFCDFAEVGFGIKS